MAQVIATRSTAAPAATKRAFSYLRVSSEGQVQTDYSRDGLSITAQREAAEDKGTQLYAEIVSEYADPGKSAYVDLHKRRSFLAMLDDLKRCNQHPSTRVDYVIVWALNRWARNVHDHYQTRELVRQAGAQLVSITEPMVGEDTPESFYMEGMFALNNQYESMKTGRNVKSSLYQKAKNGGTPGPARLGYSNTRDVLPDGRKVPAVAPDPDRHHYLTLAFQLYASGEYSVSQLCQELHRLGLRTRPTKRTPGGPITTSVLQRILRDPYYVGKIIWKRGTPDEEIFEARHEPLIDQDTFDAVQVMLDEKRVSGERPQHRSHYLRGSVFCGACRQRLTFALSRSQTGKLYPYFFCIGRVNGKGCPNRANIRPELIEDAIARYYRERPVELSAGDVQRRDQAIEALVAVSQEAVQQVQEAKTALIAKLKAQQVRLLRLHAEEGDGVSPDAFREERLRLQAEIAAAEQSLAETETRLKLGAEELRLALSLAEDVAVVYEKADERTKRGYNQAFFRRIYITPERDEEGQKIVRITGAELTEPYAVLLADDLVDGVLAEAEAIRLGAESTKDASVEAPSASSYFVKMAGGPGLEPG
jgi:DNA invertase Pin-like site-specific DNA recombinase